VKRLLPGYHLLCYYLPLCYNSIIVYIYGVRGLFLYPALLKVTNRGMGIMSFAMMTRPALFLTPAMNLVAAKVNIIIVDKIVCNCSLPTGDQ